MSESLRKAAEQALEALEDLRKFGVKQSTALFALRAALAEPEQSEPVGWSITCNGHHAGNVYPSREAAEVRMIEMNRKYPNDVRTIEQVFATPSRREALSIKQPNTDCSRAISGNCTYWWNATGTPYW